MLPAATRPILLRLPSFSSKVPFFSLFPPFFFAKIAVCLVDVLLWYPKNANSGECYEEERSWQEWINDQPDGIFQWLGQTFQIQSFSV